MHRRLHYKEVLLRFIRGSLCSIILGPVVQGRIWRGVQGVATPTQMILSSPTHLHTKLGIVAATVWLAADKLCST